MSTCNRFDSLPMIPSASSLQDRKDVWPYAYIFNNCKQEYDVRAKQADLHCRLHLNLTRLLQYHTWNKPHSVFVAVSDKNHNSRHLGKPTFHLNHRNICHILITACSKISTLTIFHFILQTHLYIHPTFFYIQKSRVAMAFPVEMAPS